MAGGMAEADQGVVTRPAPEQAAEDDALCRRLGLGTGELTPPVRSVVRRLLAEVDHLRDELARSEARVRELERLADEDALAPISNRRAFLRELMRAIRYAERYGIGGSLLYFDLNGMKAINDGFGHPAGDAVLLHVARLLLANVRASDLVGRLGGDEFGVLLVRADRAQAEQKAKALAELVERTPARFQDHAIRVGLAFGIHAFGPGEDVDAVLAAADRDMYRHKRTGREGG
jgi:diguanylate cyclase (GGDEF)-like protein